MQCKNCENTLRTDYSYCPDCGAKVIRNRITVKNLWIDIIDRYFNIDNTFLKTVLHLTTKPEVVMEGYVSGIRRKYLNPISYIGIALTISGFIVFLITKIEPQWDFDFLKTGQVTPATEKVQNITFDYQAVLFILYVPLMAIASWLSFQQKGYNFSERTVFFMYALAHYSILTFIPSVLVLIIDANDYMLYALFSLLFMYLYNAFVIHRISRNKGVELFGKVFIFWSVFTVFYFMISLAVPILLLILGEITLEDFKPVPLDN